MSESAGDFGPPEPVQAQPAEFGAPEPIGATGPDNLGVVPMPTRAQHMAVLQQIEEGAPDFAAAQAARGPNPDQATQALGLAKRNGTDPSWTADNLAGVAQEAQRADIAAKLKAAPGVAQYASRGSVEAASVKDDLDALSGIEWGLTGKWEMRPVAPDVPFLLAPKMTVPPFWAQAFSDAMKEQKFVALTTKAATIGLEQKMPQNGILPPGEVKDLLDLEQSLAQDRTYGANNFATKALVGTVKALPSLGVLAGGTAAGAAAGSLAGPVGTVAGGVAGGLIANFAESYGPLYRRLSQLQGEDGRHLLNDNEANAIAYAGAAGTSAVAELLGAGFLAKLPGVREVLNRVGGEAMGRALARPGVAAALARAGAQYGKNYLSGIAMMMAQSAGTAATEEAAKAAKGAPTDWGNVGAAAANGAHQAAQDFAIISAYHPLVEAIGAVSRSRADAANLTTLVEHAEASHLLKRSPEHAQEVVQQIAGDGSVLIDREAWDKRFGDQAAAKAAEVLGDGGRAYTEAHVTGALRVPADAWIAKMVPSGDARELLPDTKSEPELLTQNDLAPAKDEAKADKEQIERGAMAVYDDYRAKAVAAGRSQEEADAVARTTAAAFKTWGEKLKTSPAELYSRYGVGITQGGEAGPDAQLQAAYHGSPHIFDAFSMQHIGSGEGAQVFGHGLYFAENPEVARQYKENLSAASLTMKGLRGQDLVPDTRENEAFAALDLAASMPSVHGSEEIRATALRQQKNAIAAQRVEIDREESRARGAVERPRVEQLGGRWMYMDASGLFSMTSYATREEALKAGARAAQGSAADRLPTLRAILAVQESALEYLRGLNPEDIKVTKGALYTVDVPDKETLLHYDRPLREQPLGVQEKLKAAGLWPEYRVTPNPKNPDLPWALEESVSGHVTRDVFHESKDAAEGEARKLNSAPEITGAALYNRLRDSLAVTAERPNRRAQGARGASQLLNEAGIPGLRYLDQGSRAAGEGTSNFVIWDESKIRILERFMQRGVATNIEGQPATINRGFIEWTPAGGTEPRRFDIHLLETADRSTLAHETFHFLSEVMGDLAGQHDEIGADYQKLVRFMGYDSPEARTKARVAANEERASHAWEQYLATGKAPTPELDSAFARFKGWLGSIYGGVKGVADQFASQFGGRRLRLSKDVRQVFDRMLGGAGGDALRNPEREFATSALNDLRIRDISPAYYDRYAAKASQRAVDLAIAAVPKGQRDTLIITPHMPQGEPARYEVVEAGTLVPSHNPHSFTPNEAFPTGVQERFYEGQPEEQLKVTQGAANLNPALLLTNSPSPLDGPPIVTGGKKHLVLGGNGRSMMVQRAFKDQAIRDRYKQALLQRATDFGLNAADVEAMKAPVLVRMLPGLTNEAAKPDLVNAVRRYNEGLTQQLSPRARALAEARTLSPTTLLSLGDLLSGTDGSLRDVLRDKPGDVIAILRRDGVVTSQNQTQWVAGDNLTPEAKDRVEGMFLGRVMENETRMAATAPKLAGKIERAAPALLRVEGINPALDATPIVRQAIDILNDARSRELPLEDVLSQGTLFGEKPDPAVVAMARFLDSVTEKKVAERFKEWAELSAVDPHPVQSGLFGEEKPAPTPQDALGVLLGDKEAFKDYKPAAPASEAAPTPESAPAAEGGDSLPAGETGPVGVPEDTAAQIRDLHQQHQQAHEFANVARDLREEMQDALEGLRERATSDAYRAALKRAGSAYLDTFDVLMEGVGAAPKRPAGARFLEDVGLDQLIVQQGDLAVFLEAKIPVAFNVEQIRELLNHPTPWNQLTPNEARNVVDAVTNIRAAANAVNRIDLAGRKQGIRDVVSKVAAESSHRPDQGGPPVTESAISRSERIMRKAQMINADNLKPETTLAMLGETGQQLFEKTIEARNTKKKMYGEILRYYAESFGKKMPKDMRAAREAPISTDLTMPSNVDLDASKMNAETLWVAFLNLGTVSNEERLLGGYRWDKQQLLENIGRNIPKEHLDFLQGVLSYSDKQLWPLIEAHAEEVTGVAPKKLEQQAITIPFPDGTSKTYEGGYFPAKYNLSSSTLETRKGALDGVWGFDPSVLSVVGNSFTKERASSYKDVIDLNWPRYQGHIASVLHYLAYDQPVRDLSLILHDEEFRAIVKHRVGEPHLDELDDWLPILARGGTQDAAATQSYMSGLLNSALRSRAVSNALAFSLPIAVGQESHIQYAITAGEISAKNGTIAMARALQPSVWKAARETFSELDFRAGDFAKRFREAMSGKTTTSAVLESVDEAGFAMMRAADALNSHVIADAAYNDAREAKKTHEEAVTEANRKVRKLMPTHNVLEMAPVVRDRGAMGALMLFRGLPNVVWQVESGLYDQAAVQMGNAKGGGQVARASGRIAYNTAKAVASIAVLHTVFRFLSGHGKQDEDGEGLSGWATWALREAIGAQFTRLPFARDLAQPVIDAIAHDEDPWTAMKKGNADVVTAPALATAQRIVRDLGKMGVDGEPEDRVQASIDALLTVSGAGGATSVTRSGRYLYDLQQGNTEPRGIGDVLGGIGYGENQSHPRKNPATLAQDLFSGE